MQSIIIAGAGHAGLVTAAKLAANGFSVIVFENENRENLGHDWEDRFSFELLEKITGKSTEDFPDESWRYRGDCAFVSPAKRKRVEIFYKGDARQKIMWRKPLINMLIDNAISNGAEFRFEETVLSPVIENGKVTGIVTDKNTYKADAVIDCLGAFSALRLNLPDEFGIEKEPRHGDVFYSYRAYYKNAEEMNPEIPFEVYMYHEGEKGLFWCCTNKDTTDILIGRIDKPDDAKINENLDKMKADHPFFTDEIIHGGSRGVIPVRRALTLMVAPGYAAAGDSAFMTMPMNGMGIDLSLNAGLILADVLIKNSGREFTADILWEYNKRFHKEFGCVAAKNEGLKNAILSLPAEGVDFLFENDVIQSSDLAGSGRNTSFTSLLGKFGRGMRNPPYFFAIIKGLIKGAAASKLYSKPPETFDMNSIRAWSRKIESKDIVIS